jgi:hypothetical protein
VVRVIKATPNASYNEANRLLTVVFGIFMLCAAAEKLPVSTMRTNTAIAFKSTSLSMMVHSENQYWLQSLQSTLVQ